MRVFRTVTIGRVAEIMLLDIRSRRDEPVRDPVMSEPGHTMLGAEQRDWLLGELDASDAAWRIVASPSVFTRTWCDAPAEPLHTALTKRSPSRSTARGAEKAYVAAHNHVRWCDMSSHRDVVIDLDTDHVRAERWTADTVLDPRLERPAIGGATDGSVAQ